VGDIVSESTGDFISVRLGDFVGIRILQSRRGIEQPRHLLGAQHHRQLARLVNDVGVFDDLVALQRDPKKEPQCRDGLVDVGTPTPLAARWSW
jgi:hypothetical protein